MKTYKYMTIADVIAWCEDQDRDEEIQGIGELFSAYRGDASQIAIDPDEGNTHTVASLSEMLQANVGLTFVGMNGSTHELKHSAEIYLAQFNEYGPALIGFEVDQRDGYEVWVPVGLLDQ